MNDLTVNGPTITCPRCKEEIKLTESLAAPLIQAAREHYKIKLAEKDAQVARREADIRTQQVELAKAKELIDQQVAHRLEGERERIARDEAKKAQAFLGAELAQKVREVIGLEEVLADRDRKLAEAQKAQADLIRKQRELDDARREVDLTVENRVEQSLADVRAKAKREAEDGLKLKVIERDQQISSLQRQIDDLKRKAEQGSQQLQGEVQELELESLLRSKFPYDAIEPVRKGEIGGDLVQRVMGSTGQFCGSILWEIKRTRHWSDGWLAKLRSDKRAASADIAMLVSQAIPKDVASFDLIDGVWVLETRYAIPLAIALRQSLLAVATARAMAEGQQTNMELVYQYLTGPRFRDRIEAIVEKVSDLQTDLEKERKVMTRLWAKRESQIRSMVDSTVGMYGDLQGIGGKNLEEIGALELHFPEAQSLDSAVSMPRDFDLEQVTSALSDGRCGMKREAE